MCVSNLWDDWREVSVAGRILIANGFTFNLGFFMLLPYLADHLQRLWVSVPGTWGWSSG